MITSPFWLYEGIILGLTSSIFIAYSPNLSKTLVQCRVNVDKVFVKGFWTYNYYGKLYLDSRSLEINNRPFFTLFSTSVSLNMYENASGETKKFLLPLSL